MKKQPYLQILLLFSSILTTASISWSQDAAGKILGAITDGQGAAIAGARVTVTNAATQISYEAVSDKDGAFQVLLLPLGKYQVSAESEGFKRAVSKEETLRINQALRIDLKLEIGDSTEFVEVRAQGTLVETVNPTLGQSVTSRPLINMPLNGRDVLDLAKLQAGVTETNEDSSAAGSFSIAGSRTDSVTFLLDGGLNNDLLDNGVVLNPNPDAIAEFRLLTSNYTAEYGRNSGGIISVVTKSGTNELHGSVFEFLRNDALNANAFFNNRDGLPKNILKRNQFGFTIGGPITIPGVVKGKDRFFFFAGYQGQRQVRTETTGSTTIFTPTELAGDFSLSNSDRNGPDPGVVGFLNANPFFQPDPTLAARGVINPSRINSAAQNYIKNNLIPSSPTGELNSQSGAKDDSDELTLKFDLLLAPRDKLTATLGTSRNPMLNPFSNANVSGYSDTSNNNSYFANIAYIRTITPSVLNELRFTAQRVRSIFGVPATKLPSPAELGVGVTPDRASGPTLLSFARGLEIGFSPQGPTQIANNTFTLSNTLSLIKGKHAAKFGATVSGFQNNTVFDFFVNGQFIFSGSADLGGIGTGNDFADFLLGLPDLYLQFPEASTNIRTKSAYAFAQDEWRIRKNLTLTVGIRYEYNQPKLDARGRSFSLRLGRQSEVFPNAPRGLLFPGDPGAPSGANFSDKNDFAPRFGFAWDPFSNGKTSIRGGIGLFYDILKGEDNLQFNGQIPFFSTAFLGFEPLSGNPSQEVNYLTQPFAAAGGPNPFPSRPVDRNVNFADAGFVPFGGTAVFFVDPNLRTPYSFQFNLGIQREIVKDIIIEANYVGNSSRKLTALVDANPFFLGTDIRTFNSQPGAEDGAFSFLDEFRNAASANYHSLQLSLQKQLSDNKVIGTTYFALAYTLGHSIDNSSGFRQRGSNIPAYNTGLFRASSDTDIRQRITFSGGWDLPLERLWSDGPDRLVKGWSLYPIITYRMGFPLDVFAGLSRGDGTSPGPSGAGDADIVRANLVGTSVNTFDPRTNNAFGGVAGNYYFNPANFSNDGLSALSFGAGSFTYGTLPRNFFRGPGRTNFDLAIAKTTPIIRDRLNAEFRAEFFNILNHAQFNNPDTSITSGTFGQVTNTADPRIVQFALRFTF